MFHVDVCNLERVVRLADSGYVVLALVRVAQQTAAAGVHHPHINWPTVQTVAKCSGASMAVV